MLNWFNYTKVILFIATSTIVCGCVSQKSYVNSDKPFYEKSHSPQEAASNRIALGLNYLKKGNAARAKLNIDRAIELAPDMAEAHYSLAYYYQVVKEYAKARQAYQKVLRLDPKNADARNNFGVFLCQQGDIQDAREMFTSALAIEQYVRVAQTYENLGICLFDHDREQYEEEVIEYLDRALAHDARRTKSLTILQKIYTEQKDWRKALYYQQRILEVEGLTAAPLWEAYKLATLAGETASSKEYARLILSRFSGSEQAAKLRQAL